MKKRLKFLFWKKQLKPSRKVLRSHAEVENVRKNSQKEILKSRVFSAELITKDLLSPIDNLERSLQHAEENIPRSLVELVLKEISEAP